MAGRSASQTQTAPLRMAVRARESTSSPAQTPMAAKSPRVNSRPEYQLRLSFLPKPRRWKRLFSDTAAAEVERRIRSGAGAYREDWRRHLKGALNPRDFYITGEGLCFFVPMYALGGPALGVPDFLIPWAQLRPAPPGEG